MSKARLGRYELKDYLSEVSSQREPEPLSEAFYQGLSFRDDGFVYIGYVRPDHPLPNPTDVPEEGTLQIGSHYFRFSSKREFEFFLKALDKAWKEAQKKGYSKVALR